MPEVISTTERTELAPHVREGYLMLYIYLPSTFKDDFIPWVGPVIPSVLKVRLNHSKLVGRLEGNFNQGKGRVGLKAVVLYRGGWLKIKAFEHHFRLEYGNTGLVLKSA